MNRRTFLKWLGATALIPSLKWTPKEPLGILIIKGQPDQYRIITGYDPTTRVATVNRNWSVRPGSNDAYLMKPIKGEVG